MFYTIETEDGKSFYSGHNVQRDPHNWSSWNEQAHTYGRFMSADSDAQLLALLINRRLTVVRYDGAWIKTANRSVVETHGV